MTIRHFACDNSIIIIYKLLIRHIMHFVITIIKWYHNRYVAMVILSYIKSNNYNTTEYRVLEIPANNYKKFRYLKYEVYM